MRFIRLATALGLGISLVVAGPTLAQDSPLIPLRHLALSENQDLAGGDLQSIFNTTLDACERACLLDDRCQAFTFNNRNGSCFPKGEIGKPAIYDGAISGRVVPAPDGAEDLARMRAQELGFVGSWEYPPITEQATMIGHQTYIDGFTAEEMRQSALTAEGEGNFLFASQFQAAAVTLDPSADAWAEYARLSLLASDVSPDPGALANQAYLAAVNAYLRAGDKAQQHGILLSMATALERIGRGADTVRALRLAQSLQPRDDTAALLQEASGKYGFRVVEHLVQNDRESPLVCINFSDALVKSGVDYATFVQLDRSDLTVVSDGYQQLCVKGFDFGTRAELTLREGLPAADGQTLSGSVAISAYIRDRNPGVRFAGRGYVLPRGPGAALPVQSVNARTLDLALFTVTDRNLVRSLQNGYLEAPIADWQADGFENQVGAELWRGKATVAQELNRDVTTRLPLDEALQGRPAGVYVLRASVPGADPYVSPPAWQWFVISDIGLTSISGVDGLHVFARSLADARPKAGLQVDLVSRANEVLASVVTDAEGYARIDPALALGTGGASATMIIARDGDQDLAFLSLTDPEFDLSDRGVEGREAAPPVDLFLTTDRGAYRAGETVFATALARDPQARAVTGLPLTAILNRPDGVEYARRSLQDREGGYVFDLPLAATAPRGVWKLQVFADLDGDALQSRSFLVEDFLPERIDFAQELDPAPIGLGDQPGLTVAARYLFGAPGAGLRVEGETLLRKAAAVQGWETYAFGRHDSDFTPQMQPLDGGQTDAAGQLQLALTLPQVDDPGLPLELQVTTRVAEGSGRPVERKITRPLRPASAMIGVRPLFDGVVAEGAEARFSLVAVGPDLLATPMAVQWQLSRIEETYQWYQLGGNWNWEPVTRREAVADGSLDLTDGPAEIALPVTWGRYELRLEARDGSAVTSVQFDAGWYAPADVTSTPDTLEVSLDKPAYAPGDVARLRVVPRAAGVGLVTVLSNRLIAMKSVDLAEGENLVDLPVTEEWGAGVYVTVSALRPMDVPAGRNPARALGLAHAAIDPGNRALKTSLELPATADPRGPLPIAVRLEGVPAGETAHVTIAAVDQGILNLTGFLPPDPQGHFFGQRKLGVGIRDLYGRLIDGMNGARGEVRSGGDAGAQARLQAPPPTEELVAYFTGPIEVGADGYARTQFDLPSFNGTVKVMAIAWTRGGIGQASADVLVRDPVVVTASLPRFLSPGDQSRLRLEFVHASGPPGKMGLQVTAPGIDLGTVPASVDLTNEGKALVDIPLSAGSAGQRTLDIALTTPDGKLLRKTLNLRVQRIDAPLRRVSRIELAAGQELTLDSATLAGLDPTSGGVILSTGALARLDAAGLVAGLDAYPYGCTEQITSRAMPLLYLDQLSSALDLPGAPDTPSRIAEAITLILANQSANGAFGLWSPASGDMWLDAYVTDFLSRARAQGHAVPDQAFRMALDNLRNQVNYSADFDRGGEALAYALMVLAREGAAAIGDLRYYADVKGDAFATPAAMAQLGAALASYGDQPRADAMFARAAAALDALAPGAGEQVFRADYGTDRRDTALVLALASEAGTRVVDAEALLSRLPPTANASTQEASWSLLAARALIAPAGQTPLTLGGTPLAAGAARIPGEALAAAPIPLRNGGPDTAVVVTAYGTPTEPQPPGGTGYAIERQYFSQDGTPADLSALRQGDRLIAVIEITPFGRGEARLMVNDPLPAGFEIDNPNLLSSGAVTGLDWLDTVTEVAHAEFREDRFLAAVDRMDNATFRLAYQLRAISPGRFHHPAPTVEDLYRPDLAGRGAEGQLTIAP